MTTIGVILVVVAVAAVLVFWVIGVQNKLVAAEELCGNALSQIGVQQSSRWDAVTALANLTKRYSEHEYKTLMDTIAARRTVKADSSANEADKQEALLTNAMGMINALAESYPDLKANSLYLSTIASVKEFENNVRMSRMVFNDSVTKYNRLTRQLPGSLVAGSMGFRPRDYLAEEAGKTEMPDVS